MSQYALITIVTLMPITWLAHRWGKLQPICIHFSNPRREALIALIPTGILFGLVIAVFTLISIAEQNQGPLNDQANPVKTY